MASKLRVGNVEILALVDAEAKASPHALFPALTREQWEPYCEHLVDDCTRLALTIPSFVVRSEGQTLLIDSGVGAKDRPYFPNGCLPDVLREEGIDPADIDVITATHIHVDHVGWHTTRNGDEWMPTFPKARHLFVREEFEFFTAPEQANNPAFPWVNDCILPLEGKVDMTLVDKEHQLTGELTLLPAPGHTPGHSAVIIQSAGEAAVIIGDVAHTPVQISETEWSPVFDLDPAMAADTRERLVQRCEDEGWTVIAGHFPHPGFGRVVRIDGKRHWRAL